MITIIFFLGLIAVFFDALADAMRDKKRLFFSHSYEAVAVFFLLFISRYVGDLDWKEFFLIPVGLYVANRILFFDLVYNLFSGRPFTDIGDSAWYDVAMKTIFKKASPTMYLWARFVIWTVYCGYMLFNY